MRATAQDREAAAADGHRRQPDDLADVPASPARWPARPAWSSPCYYGQTQLPVRLPVRAACRSPRPSWAGSATSPARRSAGIVIGLIAALSDRFLEARWTERHRVRDPDPRPHLPPDGPARPRKPRSVPDDDAPGSPAAPRSRNPLAGIDPSAPRAWPSGGLILVLAIVYPLVFRSCCPRTAVGHPVAAIARS